MHEKLKIGYLADGIWGQNALKLISSDDDFDIKFVVPRFDTPDDVLKQMALGFGIDCFLFKNINSEEFLEVISKYNCDILVSMSFNQIFKPIILSKYKIINCHAGKLPFYRGRNILNWVLINDEKEFGITAHYVDEGVDTGDIIIQKTYPITNKDNYRTLLNVAYKECPYVLFEALKLTRSGNAHIIKQNTIDPIGLYCGKRQKGDELINWNSTSRELFNFIRAICIPGPMAKSYLNNKEVFINSAEIIDEAPIYKGISGQVLYKEGTALVVKTKDSILKITEYTYDGSIKIGDRFKNE